MTRNNSKTGGKIGRPKREKAHELVMRLSPMDDLALVAFKKAIKNGEGWAIKLFLQYRLGMPKQSVSVETITSPFTPININVITDDSTAEDTEFTEES
tara:strand:+ start:306 stop:599 length:294 start_codon:yes stop_codon:yes gene_type:complete